MSYAVDEVHPQVDFLRASDNAEVVHSEAGPVVTVRLDPTGRRGCITNPAQQLTCIELAARKRIAVSEGPVYAPFLEFDDTGRFMIYAVGARRWSQKEFILYDFETSTSRSLLVSGSAQLRFLPGGRRIIRFDGLDTLDGAGELVWNNGKVTEEHTNEVIAPEVVVYDLDQKWKITLWDNGETDGLSTYPGSDKQFLIGRERGNTRDLYRIELPE